MAADIPIQNIKHMPVAIMTSDSDNVCPADQARWIFNKIKTLDKKYIMVKNMQHERFATASDDAFLHDITRGLTTGTEYGHETVSLDDLLELYGSKLLIWVILTCFGQNNGVKLLFSLIIVLP